MWLIFLLIWNFILFSLFSISSCALPIDNNNDNNKNNKDVNLNSNLNKKDSVISSKRNVSPEGSGLVPVNEILSDDEDFFTVSHNSGRSSTIEFSGDGPLETHVTNNNNEHIVITNPGSHDSTNKNPDPHNHGDDEDDTEDDEDDDEDDEGSGDSPSKGVSNGGSDFPHIPKETIIDDDNYNDNDKMPTGNKPDATDIHTDSSEDNKDIIIDGSDKSSDTFFPGVVETSTKQNKPNRHDIDHEDDHDDLDDSHDDEDDDHDQDENTLRNDISILGRKQDTRPVSFFAQPSMLAAVIGGIVVSLLCAILLAMFIIYRTRKKDEGSYICEPSLTSPVISHYGKGSSNKFYDP